MKQPNALINQSIEDIVQAVKLNYSNSNPHFLPYSVQVETTEYHQVMDKEEIPHKTLNGKPILCPCCQATGNVDRQTLKLPAGYAPRLRIIPTKVRPLAEMISQPLECIVLVNNSQK